MTSWADAEISMAPFNYRLLGFNNTPTDYYMRPYYLAIDSMKKVKTHAPNCRGPVPKHRIWLGWVRDLFYMYEDRPKFMFHFYATLSHHDNNDLMKADHDLMLLLEHLEKRGYLNQTIVVLMGDHGARFAKYRKTWPGKLEERLPYVAFRFPPWFHQKYSQLVKNFRANTGRLTTALDLHETFKDILKFDGAGVGNLNNRGISLFKEIPIERECFHANISNHWCACLNWEVLPLTDETAVRATVFAIDTINNYTSAYRDVCAELSLGSLTMASKIAANDDMVKFKQSSDFHGRVADFTESNSTAVVLYQLTFHTEPGHGHFEVTLSHSLMNDTMVVSEKEISRINKYGNDSACILEKNRQLRQYCYCGTQSNR
ncbi:unnamed protein product [Lymnaea stagnalis]|uniref:Uncharacterized protein n=1 Tax=Lymnaea stagnalis TaxID=6523 RepID=A0AAV2ICT5_LYMST